MLKRCYYYINKVYTNKYTIITIFKRTVTVIITRIKIQEVRFERGIYLATTKHIGLNSIAAWSFSRTTCAITEAAEWRIICYWILQV